MCNACNGSGIKAFVPDGNVLVPGYIEIPCECVNQRKDDTVPITKAKFKCRDCRGNTSIVVAVRAVIDKASVDQVGRPDTVAVVVDHACDACGNVDSTIFQVNG